MEQVFRKISFILLFPILLLSCNKEIVNPVPDVTVNFQINLDMPDANNLNFPLNSIIVPNYGYQLHGVIIYNSGVDGYYAFDATCPNDLGQAVAIDPNNPQQVVCPKCKRVYSLPGYGYPTSGGGYSLKKYSVNASGRLLFVYNGY